MSDTVEDLAALAELCRQDGAPLPPTPKRPRSELPPDTYVEPVSGLRVQHSRRGLTRENVMSLLQTFAARKLRELPDPAAIATTPWMTVAVLVEKKPAKRTVKGDPYSIWVVSDLGSAKPVAKRRRQLRKDGDKSHVACSTELADCAAMGTTAMITAHVLADLPRLRRLLRCWLPVRACH